MTSLNYDFYRIDNIIATKINIEFVYKLANSFGWEDEGFFCPEGFFVETFTSMPEIRVNQNSRIANWNTNLPKTVILILFDTISNEWPLDLLWKHSYSPESETWIG